MFGNMSPADPTEFEAIDGLLELQPQVLADNCLTTACNPVVVLPLLNPQCCAIEEVIAVGEDLETGSSFPSGDVKGDDGSRYLCRLISLPSRDVSGAV